MLKILQILIKNRKRLFVWASFLIAGVLFSVYSNSVFAQPSVRDVQVSGAGIPLLSFGDLLTFIIRMFFLIAGIAALIYGLWGALGWITSGGGADEVKAAREKIQAAILGVFILIAVLSLIVALEQVVFNRQLCFGLTCPVTIPGLKVFPLDARDANAACVGMGYPANGTGRDEHYCIGDIRNPSVPPVECRPGHDRITIPIGKTIGGGGGTCQVTSEFLCCVP